MENVQTKWAIDPNHSEVQFKVKHLGISNVAGTFKIFKGDMQTDNDDFKDAKINFEVDTDSIDTNHSERDNQLKSPMFFDTQKFPKIIFSGVLHKKVEGYELDGELTIRDIKKNIKLQVEQTGTGLGRFGDVRTGFEVSGKINRKDYGITWGMLTDSGSLIVGEEIKLHFDIQLIKQTA
jgi:polyisoprenoid-binding protein YceI